MKIISISKNTAIDDGKGNPAFAMSNMGNFNGNSHIFSGGGIIVTRKGIKASVMIPWSEIDNLAQLHEPLLKLNPVDNSAKKATT